MSEFSQATLVVRGNRVYVAHDLVMSNEPQVIRDYWPTTTSIDYLPEKWREGELNSHGYSGQYVFSYMSAGFFSHIDIYLVDGGKTVTVFREEIDVPRPKTKLETKWRDGAWYRYLKARGWVRCYGLPARPDREGPRLATETFIICETCNRINGKHHEECKARFKR